MDIKHYINLSKIGYKYGIYSITDIFMSFLWKCIPRRLKTVPVYSAIRLKQKYFNRESKYFDFNGIKIPQLEASYLGGLGTVYIDTFHIHCQYKNNYEKINIKEYDQMAEGPYCVPYEDGNVMVEKGDVVIDAGAWIGDFAAYASYYGAKAVYCFDIDCDNIEVLKKTAELNQGLQIVHAGVGDSNRNVSIKGASNATKIDSKNEDDNLGVRMVALDDFVLANDIGKIDFIKADIEGFERKMLKGAINILKKHEPKLSICTYHLPDDVEVISNIILEANPRYKIVYRQHKLCAWVPERNTASANI